MTCVRFLQLRRCWELLVLDERSSEQEIGRGHKSGKTVGTGILLLWDVGNVKMPKTRRIGSYLVQVLYHHRISGFEFIGHLANHELS